jgi:hypothetical protein
MGRSNDGTELGGSNGRKRQSRKSGLAGSGRRTKREPINGRLNAWVNLAKVVPSSEIIGEDENETKELMEMFENASKYIQSFSWCARVESGYMGMGYPGIMGVFLFKIKPAKENVDNWIWVINGDLPSAYISAYGFPNPATALDGYIGAMIEWVEAVKSGDDVSDLIPVNVPPTKEWAEQLESRLKFLRDEILSCYEDDLAEYDEVKI